MIFSKKLRKIRIFYYTVPCVSFLQYRTTLSLVPRQLPPKGAKELTLERLAGYDKAEGG